MALVALDGFRSYPNAIDMQPAWSFGDFAIGNASFTGGFDTSGPGGARERYGSTNSGGTYGVTKILPGNYSRLAVSFDLRVTATTYLSINGPAHFERTKSSSQIAGQARVYFQSNNDAEFYWSIPTAATGASYSALKVAEGGSLTANETYHVELLIDVTAALGTFKLRLNGQTVIDTTFDRDRIANGYQATAFNEIMFTGGGRISNFLVYTEDADHTFPLGPTDIGYLETPNGDLAMSPAASDATFLQIVSPNYTALDLTDPPAGTIRGAALVYRVGASDGQQQADVVVQAASGGTAYATETTTVTPGTPFVTKHKILPMAALSDLANMQIKVKSGS